MSKVLTKHEEEWAYKKWCEGYTQQQIANALYVCERTVQRSLKNKPRIRPILVYDGNTTRTTNSDFRR